MVQRLSRLCLRLAGWELSGTPPALGKYVLVAAPHTSNWDFFLIYALSRAYQVRISFLMKHSAFVGPIGWWLRRVGGIPVRRHLRENRVETLAALFDESERLILVIPPEGTRSHESHWRSGFYHVARTAGVPIVLGYLDYAHRRAGFGPVVVPTGDVKADMDKIRKFYADKVGRHPQRFGPPRLREETPDDPPRLPHG